MQTTQSSNYTKGNPPLNRTKLMGGKSNSIPQALVSMLFHRIELFFYVKHNV
jgi:hypothetical protein